MILARLPGRRLEGSLDHRQQALTLGSFLLGYGIVGARKAGGLAVLARSLAVPDALDLSAVAGVACPLHGRRGGRGRFRHCVLIVCVA